MKKETLDELNYCKGMLEKELKNASAYQSRYLDWIHGQKSIVSQMKERGLPVGELVDILDFCEYRNRFLCKKMLQIDQYLLSIKKAFFYLDRLDETIDCEEIVGIGAQVHFMLVSLGLPVLTQASKGDNENEISPEN